MDTLSAPAILGSAGILGGVGLVFAALIAVTHRKFKVWEDPRIDMVAALLPGNNCGACGLPGCRAFAEKAVAGAIAPAQCTVSSPEARADIAAYLGVDVGQATQRVARLLCAGGRDVAPERADYLGLPTCKAAAAVAGGGKGCVWGCLGLADCAVACTFDAIRMNAVGLPIVAPGRCTACGDCVEACPKDLFVLMPIEHKLLVQCKSLLEGDAAERLCRVACTACGKCALDAAPGVIAMTNGLAVVDYAKNDLAGPEATRRCPTGAIVWVEGAQFAAPAPLVEGVVV
ncbi:MAG: Fe-S cluster protein [Candidatus Rokubacteria bacterium RIFCSPLOWO2_02_FULL_73_56]|nr:MAG: Fe-S cluster protein [Candidatus Rokubacteria bacterium RIFCSPHIGHO2_02_FULL_73_26]OGL10477.1 MAG: Fe-S cluster protein [Candidatus Rokubacteria bacterium RIFCSPLOWO2_02_FULL_73_56]OGL25486.1 MAG: Fe-S cluster protein [Candidatus Rokubacteria bacterium RIFCSPLOWO2_12_FULL_73_47]